LSNLIKFLTIFAVAIFVNACAHESAPVINKSPSRVIPEAYEVKQGDSVYNIAWSVGLDYLDIVKWNGLKAPYAIKPGQVINLRESVVKTTALSTEPSNIKQSAIATELPPRQAAPVTKAVPAAAPAVGFSKTPAKWNWPAEGKLVGKYAPSKGSNGIQIAGADGSAIKATAAGEIVYVGEGLRGYGKLIIVKHSPKFLSAYAHNRDILVNEGQAVKSGERIGRMGNTGAESTMLHFEIRVDGKPVDPLQYLK
jgi:lipoprotein NlpD